MDDGDLVDKAVFDLEPEEDIADAMRKANEQVAAMLDRFVPRWLTGNVVKQAQPPQAPSYCGLRIPEDGHIDWRQGARTVHNFIRHRRVPIPCAYVCWGWW